MNKKGFSLLEVGVALLILSVAVTAVFQFISSTTLSVYLIENRTYAREIATNRLALIQTLEPFLGTSQRFGESEFGGKNFNTKAQLANGEVNVLLGNGSELWRTKCVAWANTTGDISFGFTKTRIEGCVVRVTDVEVESDIYKSVYVLRDGKAVEGDIFLTADERSYRVKLNTVDEDGKVIAGSPMMCSVGRLVLFAVNPRRIPLCTVEHLQEIWKNGINSVVNLWKSINSGMLKSLRRRLRNESLE